MGQLAFSEDGRRLAAQSVRSLQPELVYVWDLDTGELVDLQEAKTDVSTYTRQTSLRCIVRREGGQWVLLVIVPNGHVVAAVESDFDLGQTHPSGLAWAWRTGRHPQWFRLEGVQDVDPNPARETTGT
jgi:hypothetical protein